MPTVYVNDKPVEIGSQRINCVQAAELAGVLVPHYCYHPALTVVASCRMCLVEVGELKDGKVLMQPKVIPGCQTPVKDGTVIITGEYAKKDQSLAPLPYDPNYKPGEKAKKSQADTLEGLLLNHPLDCPVCDKAGECKLQDYSYQYGRSESRMIDVKNTPPNKPNISSKITLFTDRCIMCSRCVRFTREISGTAELTITNRGHHAEIDVFPGRPLENKLSGNVVDLCPVGALGSKDFLYTQRVWYLKEHNGVCTGCSTGCSVYVDVNKDSVYRLRARTNLDAQGYFICDEGRWGYHYANSVERLRRPMLRAADGKISRATWNDVTPRLKKTFAEAASADAAGIVVAFSPFLTVEEAFLYATYFKGLSDKVQLILGPVPVVGEDDHYPKDVHGKSVEPVKFTIRAEKCPNRPGVESVLKHFQGEVIPFSRLGQKPVSTLVILGGYPDKSVLETALPSDFKAPTNLIVQDLFQSSLTDSASFVLPASSSFEKDGTWVNHAGLAQTVSRSVNPPKESRTELQIAFELLGRKGLAKAATIRQELAQALPIYAHLAESQLPVNGKKIELALV